MSKKLSREQFVRNAIMALRQDGYKGIHSVYSGFNELFREYYNGEDPVAATQKLQQEGKLVIVPKKGGAIIYLQEDAPQKSTGMNEQKKQEKLKAITG